MTKEFPITPPPELVQQWFDSWSEDDFDEESFADYVAVRAAQWGYKQAVEELETFYRARTALAEPEPPSLKKQALGALSRADKDALTNPLTGDAVALRTILNQDQAAIIRRALEALDD